jgi:DNA repair protein RecN (Recombination protein N)
MLKNLYIKNYILIDEMHIQFEEGLNIITGETGAGKSILVDGLAAILGDPLSKDKIRTGESRAIFEAQFKLEANEEIQSLLTENDIDMPDSELIIRRELNDSGRSRSFINDTPVSMPVLTQLGDLLIDLHGQHEHQLLLQPSRHIDYLDAFAHLDDLLKQTKTAYLSLKDDQKELQALIKRQSEIVKARELLLFQHREISAVNPEADEEEQLVHEELILRNAEKLYDAARHWYEQLYEKDNAASEILSAAAKQLGELAQIDGVFNELRAECENACLIINDVSTMLQKYAAEITFDADRLESIRQRLSLINGLKKKYGGSLQAVLEHFHSVKNELELFENVQESINGLVSQIETKRADLLECSLSLSEQRQKAAKLLSEEVTQELSRLGMVRSEFSIVLQTQENDQPLFVNLDGRKIAVGPKGMDHVEFIIRTNPGEPFKPLADVASGGEISRVMLALKTRLAETDQVPVLVFDEIDAGVSGRIAQAVGVSLRRLADSHQIVCITHLPQIASMAQHHFLVEKYSDDFFTRTSIRKLERVERQEQIARLFGGETVTDAHLKSAADLMQESESLVNKTKAYKVLN